VNPGTSFDRALLESVSVDLLTVARQVSELERGTPSGSARVPGLLTAVRCLDLTALSGGEPPADIRELCRAAQRPLSEALLRRLGAAARGMRVAGACVERRFVAAAAEELAATGIPVVAVAGGFPVPFESLEERVRDVRRAVEAGAGEIDLVINRRLARPERWPLLYEELRVLRGACNDLTMKVILAAGELDSLRDVACVSRLAMMAGADFVKTSTGRERVGAALPFGLVMARAIREYRAATGVTVGLKPAGGLKTAGAALQWVALVGHELSPEWAHPDRFRIGASSLLADLERELEITLEEVERARA
jgi:deoxyribose-phosphate aldolase